ncbi:barstar family protein [Streptomyces sp. NPDC048696]|uniref:barstar family protein n=1 Tax=Streptomyces sp. NPDC048696 TaxID=3365585 RepID=UPI00371DCF26
MTADPFDGVRASGWQVDVLDLTGVNDKAGFMDRCARALRLPEWFGRNWDALADCLGDPDWGPARPGRLLVVTGWQDYEKARPDEWLTAREVLADAAVTGGDGALAVVLALGALA